MVKTILITILIMLILCWVIGMLSVMSNGKICGKVTHKIFSWHYPNEKTEFHGINEVSTCKYCGKKIIKCHLDWFADEC